MTNELANIVLHLDKYKESEWIEWKSNFGDAEKIAETICALSNGACIKKQPYAYMIRWIDNETQEILPTGIDLTSEKTTGKKKKQWTTTWFWLLNTFKSQINLELLEDNIHKIFAIKIQSARGSRPTVYNNIPFLRIKIWDDAHNQDGHDYPHLLKEIYNNSVDITADITDFKIENLDIDAINVLKGILYENPNNEKYRQYDDDELFRRLWIIKGWYLTFAWALLLLQEDLAYDFFSDKYQITRKYEDTKNAIVERKTRTVPLIKCFDDIEKEVQRFNTPIVETNLFRKDLKKYESKAIRELLFNAIVHRDWTINSWIEIKQTPQKISFLNPWIFVANLMDVLRENKRPSYRNPTLSNIFKSLNYIEKEGGWLRDVYALQLKKWLRIIPNFDTVRTSFTLLWYIEHVEFAKKIINASEIDVYDLVLLDRIAQWTNSIGKDISEDDVERLKLQWYIDISGTRYRVANISLDLATRSKNLWVHTRVSWVNRERYEQHVIEHIQKHWKIYMHEVKDICIWKKDYFCSNLLRAMRKKDVIKIEKPEWTTRDKWYHVLV